MIPSIYLDDIRSSTCQHPLLNILVFVHGIASTIKLRSSARIRIKDAFAMGVNPA